MIKGEVKIFFINRDQNIYGRRFLPPGNYVCENSKYIDIRTDTTVLWAQLKVRENLNLPCYLEKSELESWSWEGTSYRYLMQEEHIS